MIQVFNKILFGSDAEAFLALDVNAKVNFIKKNTNQSNDDLINEFLTNLLMYKNQGEICIGCKLQKDGDNIGKGNAVEVTTDSQQELARESSELDNNKRPRQTKARKG